MALDLMRLAALGVLPGFSTGQVAPPAPGASLFPIGADGVDPLAPLPDVTPQPNKDSQNKLDQPWRSDALLSFGAGLLSGRNFFDGLAKGATAAQQARDAYMNPKRDLLANGAFTYEQYPDGTTKLVPNSAVQDYATQQALISYEGKAALAQQNAKYIADRMAANNDAQLARTQAQIDAADRRSAAQLESTDRYHTEDLKLREKELATKETPYQQALDQNQAKADAALPDQISQAKEFSSELNELIGLVNKGTTGIGAGTAAKANRGLARVLPSAAEHTGINYHDLKRAEQITNHIRMIATREWLKGMGGSRLTNYDLKLATTAQPNLEMDPQTFLKSVRQLKALTDEGLTRMQGQYQQSQARAAGGSASGGVTSGGIHWQPVD